MKINNPKTKEELDAEKLLPAGEYSFVISDAEERISKNGNDMIKLTVRVFKPNGKFILLNDYLLEAMQHKLVHACQACGLYDSYLQGSLKAESFIGKSGMLKLGIQKSDDYPDRNQVKDYIPSQAANIPKDQLTKALEANNDLDEDTLPF